MAEFVAAIDQGTTSTRCMIFDHNGIEVGRHQLEHEQILLRAGWVEHNPVEIWERTQSVLMSALNNTRLSATDLVTALYFYKMRYDPANPSWPERDRFIMSKGHSVPALGGNGCRF